MQKLCYLCLPTCCRCGLLQEGDRVLAINGWSLKARTLRDVSEMIAVSRRHLTLRIEFDVAGQVSSFAVVVNVIFVVVVVITEVASRH